MSAAAVAVLVGLVATSKAEIRSSMRAVLRPFRGSAAGARAIAAVAKQ